MSKVLPNDAAQVVLWFRGLPQPTIFLTTRKEAEHALDTFRMFSDEGRAPVLRPCESVEFQSYPTGENRSCTIVPCSELRGLTIEWPSIALSS